MIDLRNQNVTVHTHFLYKNSCIIADDEDNTVTYDVYLNRQITGMSLLVHIALSGC